MALSVPKWSQSQDLIAGHKGTVQQSLQDLLSKPILSTDFESSGPSPFGRPHDPSPVSTHEKFASFLAGEDFKSVLLLENVRPDLPITFTPTLILNSGEVPLGPVVVAAHSTATVDISAILKERGFADKRGTVSIRFDFSSYGPGIAVVQMRDDKHHVYLNSYAQSSEEYWGGTTYDGVVWAPHESTQGFIAITNASGETHSVRLAFFVNGRREQQPEIQILPRHISIVPIDELLTRSRKAGAGIHIEYTQGTDEEYPGAILVEGQLFNQKTGFAKNIHFMDKVLPPTGTLRSHFLFLGRQPVEDNFPAGILFRSVAAIRNIENAPVTVTPTVKFLRNQALQTVTLPPRLLGAAESALIDFSEEQKAGRLPADFTQGSLELTPDTGHNSIVGELFNFSQTGGFVVGPSFTSYPTRSTSSIWRTDGSFQTTIMAANTADIADRVKVRLFSEHGQYIKTFDMPAGQLIKINLRDLQQNSVPDDNGAFLVDTSGIMSLIADHGTKSKISYDKIIHSADQSDYVGLPANPCDYVTTIAMWIDNSTASNPMPVMKTYYWTQSGEQDSPQGGSSSSNTSLAQISNNGGGDMVTFTVPNDGQTHTVNISPPFPQELTQFCDACSSGDVTVLATGSIFLRIALTSWGPPPTVSGDACSWSNLACQTGSPTCRGGFAVIFVPGCPSYVLQETLVVGGVCIPPSVVSAASGPGPCN
ncbi:MAG TPA: hypothetical protein VGK21_16840 [Candidatus Angelobacter sp.]